MEIKVSFVFKLLQEWAAEALQECTEDEIQAEIKNTILQCGVSDAVNMRRYQFIEVVALLFNDIEDQSEFMEEMDTLEEIARGLPR